MELPSGAGQNMFGFWKNRLTEVLIDAVKADDGILIHLATEEYQHLFDWQRVRREVRIIQPLFYVRKGSNLKIQAVWAKTCRGAMTRFTIENRIDKSVLFEQEYIYEKSGHTRGSTVDLTLFDMASGKELDMGGTFDWFGIESHPDFCGNPETGEYTGGLGSHVTSPNDQTTNHPND